MKIYIAVSFISPLSLEELAARVGLDPVEFDAENKDEWALGAVGGFSDIDICRTHLVPPGETRTSILRYNQADRAIPANLIRTIHEALKDHATEFRVNGIENNLPFDESLSDVPSRRCLL